LAGGNTHSNFLAPLLVHTRPIELFWAVGFTTLSTFASNDAFASTRSKKKLPLLFLYSKKKRFVRKIKEIDAVPETSPDIS
jgi:hypothetical protein